MAVKAFDDFTGQMIEGGWQLQSFGGSSSKTFHIQNLSGLLHALAYRGSVFGMDDDKAVQKLAELRVSKAPTRKNGSKDA